MACEEKKRHADAWLLDPDDHLAARLARDGDPEETYFAETDMRFAISWRGKCRINSDAFVYIDRDFGRMSAAAAASARREFDSRDRIQPRDCTDRRLAGSKPAPLSRKPYQRCDSAALAGQH
jgi:hypothetical protein